MPTFGLTDGEVAAVRSGPKRLADALNILEFAASRPKGVTCDECTEALGLRHQACSPRFSELESAGCLVDTGASKKTLSGSRARLMKVPADTDFRAFMLHVRSKRVAPRTSQILTPRASALLEVVESFLHTWKRVKSKQKQTETLRTLLAGVIKADQVKKARPAVDSRRV